MTCVTTKTVYKTMNAAMDAAGRQGHLAYHCEYCHLWHTTKDTRPKNFGKTKKLPTRAVERVWEL